MTKSGQRAAMGSSTAGNIQTHTQGQSRTINAACFSTGSVTSIKLCQALKIEHNPNVSFLHKFEQLEGLRVNWRQVRSQGLKQERCGFTGRFRAPRELANTSKDSGGQRRLVVAGIQNVGFPPLSFLLPHYVRAWWEKRPRLLPIQLHDDSRNPQNDPHGDQDEIWRNIRHDKLLE